MEEIFNIDTTTCTRDGICAQVCPLDIITLSKDGYPRPSFDAEALCIRCGHCVAVCPTGSFNHRDMDRDQCPPIRREVQFTADQVEFFLRSRRSIRSYKDKPVSREILQKLIEIARYAPSAHNDQKVEWLVFGNRKKLRALAGITVDWMRWVIETMPERAAELHLEKRVTRWEHGVDGILRDAPALILAHGEKAVPVLPPGYVPEMDNVAAPLDYAIALTYRTWRRPRKTAAFWREFIDVNRTI